MSRAFGAVFLAYTLALAAAIAVVLAAGGQDPLWRAALGDVVATLVVFAFSLGFRNASFYDPYWSVAPIAIAVYWIATPQSSDANATRQLVVLALITWWGLRLTWNWARGWQGLAHEDWRYVQLREQSGRAWPLVNFTGIHFFPTVIVFLGLLPVYCALSSGSRPWSALDVAALVVAAAAIACEQLSDRQLLRFRRSEPAPQAILDTGLWSRSRHPNYLGEMGFWWGLYLFGLAAKPEWWWTIVGALGISVMFRVVSLPMIEGRMLARRPGYAELQERIPMVVPRLGG